MFEMGDHCGRWGSIHARKQNYQAIVFRVVLGKISWGQLFLLYFVRGDWREYFLQERKLVIC